MYVEGFCTYCSVILSATGTCLIACKLSVSFACTFYERAAMHGASTRSNRIAISAKRGSTNYVFNWASVSPFIYLLYPIRHFTILGIILVLIESWKQVRSSIWLKTNYEFILGYLFDPNNSVMWFRCLTISCMQSLINRSPHSWRYNCSSSIALRHNCTVIFDNAVSSTSSSLLLSYSSFSSIA